MINVSLSYQFCTYPLTVKTKGNTNLIHLEVITLQPFAYKLTRCGPQMQPQPFISKHFPILSLFSPIFPVTRDSMIKKNEDHSYREMPKQSFSSLNRVKSILLKWK